MSNELQSPTATPDAPGARAKISFSFTPEQLGTLHMPKNLSAFLQLGGEEGIVKGLRSDRNKGIGASGDTVDGSTPNKGAEVTPSSFASHTSTFLKPLRSVTTGAAVSTVDPELSSLRKAIYGNNHLPARKQPSFLELMWGAYNDPALFLLTAAAAVSLAIGIYQSLTTVHSASNPGVEWVEGVAILAAVIIIVLVGSLNDWEKQRQFRKLNEKQLERDAKVIRSGDSKLIAAADILVGDVVRLEPGDVVPADGLLLTGYNVMCDESMATGESELVHKTPCNEALRAIRERSEGSHPDELRDIDPFVLSGAKVLEGVGTFIVTATGINSTYGRILSSLSDESDPTPLQSRLAVLAKYIARIGVFLAVLLFIALFIRFLADLPHDSSSPSEKGKNFVNILIISLTVLVIAVPEGLPLAVTLSLAYATTRMMKDHSLVRQLKACEIMGNATNICSDKTGTLTENKMAVVAGTVGTGLCFDVASNTTNSEQSDPSTEAKLSPTAAEFAEILSPDVRRLLRQSIALNSTAFEGRDGSSFVGSNTESALLNFARDYLGMGPVKKEREKENIVQLIPFNGARKCMATIINLPGSPGTHRVFIKGASEILLSKCTRVIRGPEGDHSVVEMSSQDRAKIAGTIESYATKALRTISLVYQDLQGHNAGARDFRTGFTLDSLPQDLIFLGVVAIQDPLRPGVSESVKTCQRAGVTVRMVTGDNIQTAKTIATQCGILSGNNSDIAMEGTEFRALSDINLKQILPNLKVIARSSPDDKQRLVVTLKEMGEIVAVTGDGTNDAPAMSAADVSFAMGGITGTEVAREASSIILMTDDFTYIVKAIMWGRAVNDSVKKFLQFQISITVTSVLLAFVSAISNPNEESVLTPVQLMWINLFQDTLAALALATDRPLARVLDRKPEARTAPLITITMWKTIIGQSLYQLAVTFILYFAGPRIFAYQTDEEISQVETLVFNAYVWMQIFAMYNSRQYDDTLNIFEGAFGNWLFLSIITIMVGAQVLIIFVGSVVFSVVWLTGPQWGVSLVVGVVTLGIGALTRLFPNWPLQKMVDIMTRRRTRDSSAVDSS